MLEVTPRHHCSYLLVLNGWLRVDMGLRLPNVADLYHKLGLNVLLVSYRGYGDSEGTPSGNIRRIITTVIDLLNVC